MCRLLASGSVRAMDAAVVMGRRHIGRCQTARGGGAGVRFVIARWAAVVSRAKRSPSRRGHPLEWAGPLSRTGRSADDRCLASGRPPVRDGVAYRCGSSLHQLMVRKGAQRIVDDREGGTESDKGRDREDLRVVITGIA